jgi:hypothetical protein
MALGIQRSNDGARLITGKLFTAKEFRDRLRVIEVSVPPEGAVHDLDQRSHLT